MTLLGKVINGVSWSFASRVSSQLLQLAFVIVLARLLNPGDYGIIAMLAVFTGFAQALADGGLSSALIHNQQTTERHFSTVFWIQLAIGVSLSVLFFLGAPLIAAFYSVPNLEPLSRLASCIFLIQAAGNVHSTLLVREFNFRALSIITFTATGFSGIAAIGLALQGYGVWALAWQPLVFSAATTGILWIQSKWRPSFVFDLQAAGELGRYGIYLLGFGSVNYWLRSLDNLLIGKFLGAYQLGIYARAYQLMLFPITNLTTVVGQVIFPALAQIQSDIPRFRRSYVSATCMIALISFPLMTGIAVLSEPLILVTLGSKWVEVIPVLKLLSFVGLLQSIVHPVGWIFNSLGKTKASFHLSILLAPAFIIAIGIGLRFGVLGVASGYAAWALVDGFLSIRIGGKYIGLTVSSVLMGVARIALMSAIMGIIVFSLDLSVFHVWPPTARLFAGTSVGVTSYVALCVLLKDATFAELNRLIFQLFDRSGSI